MTGPTWRRVLLACLGFVGACPALCLTAAELDRVAARSNQSLPRMVAKDLRQDPIEVFGMTLVYNYKHLTLDSGQLRGMRLEETQRPYVLPSLCADPDSGRMLREGVRFRYVYRGRDSRVGGEFLLSQLNCSDRR